MACLTDEEIHEMFDAFGFHDEASREEFRRLDLLVPVAPDANILGREFVILGRI
jgi:hypothetical protein